jgi:hypothetical protein
LVTQKISDVILEARPLSESITEGITGDAAVIDETDPNLDQAIPVDDEFLKAFGATEEAKS